jgi:predicted dehydrogenase
LKKIQCAVIGCGRIGCSFDDSTKNNVIMTHAGSYYYNTKTNLVALCDVDKIKLKKYGRKYSVSKLFDNPNELFENMDLDCVSICTHANSHLELVKIAAKNGIKAIFLEKPISNSISNSLQIIEICKKNKIKLLIDHQRRFDPFFINLKKFVNNKIGKIQTVNIIYGGGIVNTGTHIIDLLRYFFGEISSVNASLSQNSSYNTSDPNLDGKIIFKNKIICFLHALDLSHYGFLEMQIFGTNSVLKINLTNNDIDYRFVSKKPSLAYKTLEIKNLNFEKSKKSAIFLGVENLVTSISNKSTLLCTGQDGLKSLEGVISLIKSAKSGQSISIPLKITNYQISSK